MKPNTALGVGALGFGLAISQLGGPVRLLSLLFAAFAAVVGAVTLVEYSFNWDIGIDQLLFFDPATPVTSFPGRPAPLTALLLAMLGVGLSGTEAPGWRHVRTSCSVISLLITWTLLNGYLFGSYGPSGVLPFGSVAVHTAATLFLIALGVLATQPGTWPVSTVFAGNVGGTICRWLLPAAMLAPPVLGWLLRDPLGPEGPRAAFSWALYSVFSSAGSASLILVLAHRIEILDAERTAATMMSRYDVLTGLANRRSFDAFLLESFTRARRYQRPLSLLTIDVDHFKSYNDTFGHPAGDEVLRAIAMVFGSIARETDLAARIGGEEFAIVLPETASGGAYSLAERIRASVADLRLRRHVTVSIGIAVLSGSTPTSTALLEESDAALYRAKRGGRDRVVVAAKPLAVRAL
jgi:diguanylate cyclase (GGDEF)-like protein